MRQRLLVGRKKLMLIVLLCLPGVALSQGAQQGGTFTVTGHDGQAAVVQMNGRSYVDVESLARLTNGAVSYKGNQIALTLPGGSPTAPTAPVSPGLTRDFSTAGIEEMALIREWRSALINMVQNGYPITEAWMVNYRGPAASNLRLAGLAVSTDADRKAFQLLTNEFNNMQQSSQRFLSARANLTYVPQDSLNNDPMDQKIVTCARALAGMVSSGQFQDDSSCH
jgi:hypothetical protein